MINKVATKNLGIGMVVDLKMLKWGSKETYELDPGCEKNVSNWTKRSGNISGNGIKLLEGTMILPTPHTLICNLDNIYVKFTLHKFRERYLCSLLEQAFSTVERVEIYSFRGPSEIVTIIFL